MGWLEGKVALVTGASSGIGEAVADRFVREGARVGIMARSAEKLNLIAARHDGRVQAIPGDVTVFDDNVCAVEETVSSFGRLDIFVANAGIFDCFAPLSAMSQHQVSEAFDEIFAVNVKGAILGAKAALPALTPGTGAIIVTLSQAAHYPGGGGVLYTATKHALAGVIKQLAYELAPGIRVNGVAPGGTVSEVAGPHVLDEFCRARPHGQERAEMIRHRNPLRLAQMPEDHTGAYVLLASDQSRATTGTVIDSDGGLGIRGNPQYD